LPKTRAQDGGYVSYYPERTTSADESRNAGRNS
jgi:hypothetical protein